MKKILPLLLLVSALGLTARGTPLDDKIRAFQDALKSATPASPGNPMYAERMAEQFDSPMMRGGEANEEAMIRQIMSTNPSKAVQQAGDAVIEELEMERKARLDELTAKIDAALAPVPDAIAKADKPADLDPVLDSLQRITPVNGGAYGYDADMQAQNQRLNAAYQFVAQWQDYLSYRDTKNIQQELNTLRNLLNSRPAGTPLVSRSEILARIAPLDAQAQANNIPRPYMSPPPPDLAPILDGVKTLDDLEPAIQKIVQLPNQQNYNQAELTQLAFLYGQAKNGLPVSLDLKPQYMNGTPQPGVARIESMVLQYLLPRFLGAGAPPPNPGEQVDDYLARVMTAAETAEDWSLLQRVIDARVKIANAQQTPPGTQQFLAGLSQEIAGQYARAVTDYQTALAEPDNFTPAKLIADRLAAIKKDHSSEYDDGIKGYAHPATPAYPIGYPGYNPYARFGMPYPVTLPPTAPAAAAPTVPAMKFPTSKVPTPSASHTNTPAATPPAATK